MRDAQLKSLAEKAWCQHRSLDGEPWLVKPSMPILYFGDEGAYQRSSEPRIITVALNPSNAEFPTGAPCSRFPVPADRTPEPERYLTALDEYFRTAPYWGWFNFYEEALIGAGASYRAAALHTDVASCLATSPTWSRLDREARAILTSDGVFLWHELAEYLRPDILLWSTAAHWLELIEFAPLNGWECLRVFDKTDAGKPRVRPPTVRSRWYEIGGKRALLVFAPALQKPLGSLSHAQKRVVGEIARAQWASGVS